MASFYAQLKAGANKAQALQNARLQYLNQTAKDRAHPYYWAGFVVQGNSQPIQFAEGGLGYWWLLILGVVLGGIYLFFKKNRG